MSSKSSKNRSGWLYSFLSLFVRQPYEPEAGHRNRNDGNAASTLMPDGSSKANLFALPAKNKKTPDWDKAREFQFAARLSVDRKFNRPKLVETKSRKLKPSFKPAPQWKRAARPSIKPSVEKTSDAIVIAFPAHAQDTAGHFSKAA